MGLPASLHPSSSLCLRPHPSTIRPPWLPSPPFALSLLLCLSLSYFANAQQLRAQPDPPRVGDPGLPARLHASSSPCLPFPPPPLSPVSRARGGQVGNPGSSVIHPDSPFNTGAPRYQFSVKQMILWNLGAQHAPTAFAGRRARGARRPGAHVGFLPLPPSPTPSFSPLGLRVTLCAARAGLELTSAPSHSLPLPLPLSPLSASA